ncbi:MAG: ABC transporter permease subunit [Oscillospiraceae bacterium]|nr:ABC transporter permease subunit [Oscillospiraceae bacterium]MBQ5503474.1 ABC transporter permease subunit [Oscillospiraceae bacterium]
MPAKAGKKLLSALFWLIVWQGLSLLVNNKIVIVGPYETALALFRLIPTGEFWAEVGASTLRITVGFLSGAAAGITLAALAYRSKTARELFAPLVGAMKAVPVASFVVLALIWFGSSLIGFFVSLVVTLPILYVNTLEGLLATDRKLIELAEVYSMRFSARVRGIFFPQLFPYLRGALGLGVGTAWKAGIAAEVIGQPLGTLGNELYRAKIYLETDKVLAVTVAAVTLSWAIGKLAVWAFSRLERGRER